MSERKGDRAPVMLLSLLLAKAHSPTLVRYMDVGLLVVGCKKKYELL